MDTKHIKLRLTVMNFLQFAIWGAYLTSMGRYLGAAGFAEGIGNFYAMQGIVSLFMPALDPSSALARSLSCHRRASDVRPLWLLLDRSP